MVIGVTQRAKIIRLITQASLMMMIVGSLQPARPGTLVAHHRGIHFLAFGGVAFLLLLRSRNRRQEIHIVVAMCLLGLSLEFLQHLIYHKAMEWWDVRDDSLASVGAFLLYRVLSKCRAVFASRARPGPADRDSFR